MKKYLISSIILGLLLSFSGCGGGSSSSDSVKDDSKTGSVNNAKFKFTKEYLDGKTFYYARNMCINFKDGNCEGYNWELSVISYTDTNITMYNIKQPSNKAYIKNYTISQEGYIEFYRKKFKKDKVIKPIEKTADFISVIWTNKGNSKLNSNKPNNQYMYFDKTKAETLVKSKNAT